MSKKIDLPQLSTLKSVHVIGVCGTLMGAFAAYLKRSHIHVTGSDQNIYPPMSEVLGKAGVELYSGYRVENLRGGERPDLVVVGNVIRSDNPEAREAIDQGYCYSSLPEAMERLFLSETRNLVVAGTHGKTTTSSLMAHILVSCHKNPSYFIGGVSHDLPFSFHLASIQKGKLFVLEGDEYDTAFWDKVPKFNHYLPDDVILTSVEFDHADIYPDLAAVLRAFEGLVSRVRSGGKIIACYDYPNIRVLMERSVVPVISYGRSMDAQTRYTPGNVLFEASVTRFEVLDRGKKVDEITIQLPGIHNVLNALAVWIQCQDLEVDSQEMRNAFQTFRGVKRRQEVLGVVQDVVVIDDFAHHPTAVRETLVALKAKYPQRRLIAVFEPRSATSRRKIFQKDYALAFSGSDIIFISNPYDQTRIASEDQFSSGQLVADLKKLGKEAYLMDTVEEGVQAVSSMARPGDLITVLSNGGFGGFNTLLLESLKRRSMKAV